MVIRHGPGRARRVWLLGLLAVGAVFGLVGCSIGSDPKFVTPPPRPATLIISQADGAGDVSPAIPITVEVVDGELSHVSLASDDSEVQGAMSTDLTYWTSAVGQLGFGKTYTLQVESVGDDGKAVEETRTFTTVAVPQGHYYSVTIGGAAFMDSENPSNGDGKVNFDGGTFGVGTTISARFDDIVDRRVAESLVKVETDKPVTGAWSWVSEYEMHWRPKEYWPAQTQVTVTANIFGVKLISPKGGRELFGRQNASASFTIGDSKIAKVDNNTHLMTVYINGELAAVQDGRGCAYNGSENYGCANNVQSAIRVALGKGGVYTDIAGHKYNYATQSGVHIVMEKGNPVTMEGGGSCPSKTPGAPDCDPGWYREIVPLAVRLNYSGVYVHAADWNTGLQGNGNGSHGCVNIHPKDAAWFYNTFGRGDVVEIVNTGRPEAPGNGNTDWDLTWDQWLAGSALGTRA